MAVKRGLPTERKRGEHYGAGKNVENPFFPEETDFGSMSGKKIFSVNGSEFKGPKQSDTAYDRNWPGKAR